MNHLRSSRSSLFLMELIIVILFFSIGSAVCIQGFVKAHLLSQSAQDLSFASSAVSSAASVIRYTDGSLQQLDDYFPNAEETEDGFSIYYNAEHALCEKKEASYILYIQTSQTAEEGRSHIWMTDKGDTVLYELQLQYPLLSSANIRR